jgi:hypothetical protein
MLANTHEVLEFSNIYFKTPLVFFAIRIPFSVIRIPAMRPDSNGMFEFVEAGFNRARPETLN